jgi:hypothetical protein
MERTAESALWLFVVGERTDGEGWLKSRTRTTLSSGISVIKEDFSFTPILHAC